MKLCLSLVIISFFGLMSLTCRSSAKTIGESLGRVGSALEEASGLVASVRNPGMLWAINDSGNPAEVFLIDLHANTRLVCTLSQVRNRDWEDIGIGTGPDPNESYLYVADIGDNWAQYEFKFVYRFKEPALQEHNELTINEFDTLIFKMPDGKRDTETILIDPLNSNLFFISKREDSVALYQAPSLATHDTLMLSKVLTLPFTKIVAGSITFDGTEILLKDYNSVYYWKRSFNESLPDALRKVPTILPYEKEPQGEAIAWSRAGEEFYTLSEGSFINAACLLAYRMKKQNANMFQITVQTSDN